MTDDEIIALYQRRDESAIQATSDSYGPYCHSIADRILGSQEDAEECVNDTWLRAWNTIPPQRPNCLRMFLAKITRNLAFDAFKRGRAGKRGGGELLLALDELEECVSDGSDVESAVITEELRRGVDRFLRELPRRERDVFLRRYFFVESTGEIAERYGLRPDHVLVILSRTRKKLRSYLEKEELL